MEAVVKRILIIRNDSSTAWENSSYIPKKGELGVAFIEETGKPVVKVGNGVNVWNDLPQNEYVLEKDMIISYDFGKFKADRGYVNTGGKGLTLSEWLKNALIDLRDAIVTQPSLALTITANPTPSTEIGSKVNSITWNAVYTDGQYEFGHTGGEETNAGTEPSCSIFYKLPNSEEKVRKADTFTGTLEAGKEIVIDKVGEVDCGEVEAYCSWFETTRIPVNSIGDPQPGDRLLGGSLTENKQCKITGYREGCFYGAVKIANFSEDSITNTLVRGLTKTKKNYAAGTLTYGIKSGDTAIVIAIPKGKTITSVLNTTVNAEMFGAYDASTQKYGNFKKVTKEIGGADSGVEVGDFPMEYDIYYYKPEYAYSKAANITIKLAN